MAVDRANLVHFTSAFRPHPELAPSMKLVYDELVTNLNNSTQIMYKILGALSKKMSFRDVPLPNPLPSNGEMLHEILLVLKQFNRPIIVCYADMIDETTQREFGVDPTCFGLDSDLHALTFRAADHSRAAIILSEVHRVPTDLPSQHLYAKEVILHELIHVLTARFCSYIHEPPSLFHTHNACEREAGYVFERMTRGSKMEVVGNRFYLTRPCSSRKRTAMRLLTAAELVALHTSAISSLNWPQKRRCTGTKNPRGTKASRGRNRLQSDTRVVPVPNWR